MTALFTVILGISTIGLWRSTKGAIKVASDGVEVARRTYVAEHRTWLKLYPIEIGPVTFDGDKSESISPSKRKTSEVPLPLQ